MEAYIFNALLDKIHNDPDALKALYSYYYSRIILHLQKQFNHYIAEEAAQQFFLQLMTNNKEYPYIQYPTSWVYTCCNNIAKRLISKDSRNFPLIDTMPDKEMISIEEIFGDLYYLVSQQDSIAQEILKLHFIEGYNLKEIANMLNISYANIRQKYSRTLKKMKKDL